MTTLVTKPKKTLSIKTFIIMTLNVMPNVIVLSATSKSIMLNVIMLNVIMLNVIVLNVVSPESNPLAKMTNSIGRLVTLPSPIRIGLKC